MQKIFDDVFHKNVECYVDDLVVKTKMRKDDLTDLHSVFDRLSKYQLKMNPLKCVLHDIWKVPWICSKASCIKIDQFKIDAI